jgi:hypothetical protein
VRAAVEVLAELPREVVDAPVGRAIEELKPANHAFSGQLGWSDQTWVAICKAAAAMADDETPAGGPP